MLSPEPVDVGGALSWQCDDEGLAVVRPQCALLDEHPNDFAGRAPGRRRVLLVAREHANTTRTAAVNIFKSLLLTAPDQLREALRCLSTPRQTSACALPRVYARHSISGRVLRQTLRSLARQIRLLDREIRANERQLRELVNTTMPTPPR